MAKAPSSEAEPWGPAFGAWGKVRPQEDRAGRWRDAGACPPQPLTDAGSGDGERGVGGRTPVGSDMDQIPEDLQVERGRHCTDK